MECCVDGCLGNQGLLGGCLLGVLNSLLLLWHYPPSEAPPGPPRLLQNSGQVERKWEQSSGEWQLPGRNACDWPHKRSRLREWLGVAGRATGWAGVGGVPTLGSSDSSWWEIIAPISQMGEKKAQRTSDFPKVSNPTADIPLRFNHLKRVGRN